MRSIRLLHLRHVWEHPLRSVIAVIAVASGVALTVTTSVVQSSTMRSFERYAQSFSGPAPLRVVGPVDRGGLRESAVARVDAVDGVASAVPLIQAVALAEGDSERDVPVVAVGYDCRIEKLVGKFGCVASAVESARTYRPPVISRSLRERLGPDAVIRTNDGPKTMRGAAVARQLDELNNGNVIALPIHVAQVLFTRPGAVDVIYVLPERGVDVGSLQSRLERAVGEQNIVLQRDQTSQSFQFFTQLYLALAAIGLGTFATGAVLAHNALALSLEQRRRDLAVAAAVGARPRSLFIGALAEGAVLGIVGGLVGAVIGIALAYPVLDGFQFFAERFAGLRMSIHLSPSPLVVGALLGIVVGVIAAFRPARRASRIDVVTELQQRGSTLEASTRVSSRRGLIYVVVGIVAIAVTRFAARDGALEAWQPFVSQLAGMLAVAMFVLAVAQFAPLAFSVGSRFARGSAAPRLAWANLVGEGWRSASMVLAASSAVVAGSMIANMGQTVLGALSDQVAKSNADSVLVSTIPTSNSPNLESKPSPRVAAGLSRIEGVEKVHRATAFGVASVDGLLLVEALDDQLPSFDVLKGRVDPQAFARGESVVGPGIARRYGVGPGDVVRLPGRDGAVTIPVQAIVADGDSAGLEIAIPLSLAERTWGPQPPIALVVDPAEGTDGAELARRIEAARLDPNLTALTGEELQADVRRENSRFFAPFWALQRALIVIAFGAVLSNLLLVALRRKRELGLVSAVGMSPSMVARMVVIEALATGVVAVVLGSVAALAASEAFRNVLFIMIPYPMPLRIDAAAPFVYGAITFVVLLLAAAWPAWRTSRMNVVDALRAE